MLSGKMPGDDQPMLNYKIQVYNRNASSNAKKVNYLIAEVDGAIFMHFLEFCTFGLA